MRNQRARIRFRTSGECEIPKIQERGVLARRAFDSTPPNGIASVVTYMPYFALSEREARDDIYSVLRDWLVRSSLWYFSTTIQLNSTREIECSCRSKRIIRKFARGSITVRDSVSKLELKYLIVGGQKARRNQKERFRPCLINERYKNSVITSAGPFLSISNSTLKFQHFSNVYHRVISAAIVPICTHRGENYSFNGACSYVETHGKILSSRSLVVSGLLIQKSLERKRGEFRTRDK